MIYVSRQFDSNATVARQLVYFWQFPRFGCTQRQPLECLCWICWIGRKIFLQCCTTLVVSIAIYWNRPHIITNKKNLNIVIVTASFARTVRCSYFAFSLSRSQWRSSAVAPCIYSPDLRSLVICSLASAEWHWFMPLWSECLWCC